MENRCYICYEKDAGSIVAFCQDPTDPETGYTDYPVCSSCLQSLQTDRGLSNRGVFSEALYRGRLILDKHGKYRYEIVPEDGNYDMEAADSGWTWADTHEYLAKTTCKKCS